MPETKLSSTDVPNRKRTPTPAPDSDPPGEPLPPPNSFAEPLDAALVAEAQGERWIMLDAENLLRAADFRRIQQNEKDHSEKQHQGRRHHAYWPLPGLTINDSLTLPRPLWSVEELLEVIGAEIVLPRRSPQDLTWEIGPAIPNTEYRPMTSAT